MISGQQLKEVIEHMFSGTAGFILPTATWTSYPLSYPATTLPASVSLYGVITGNSGVITSWSITDSSAAVLATGTNGSPSVSLTGGLIPSTIGLNTYFLTVFYTDANGAASSFVESTSFSVTSDVSIGQLATGVDIILPADLTGGIESTLNVTTQQDIINLFDVVATTTGRVIFVIPDSLGSVTDISDNTNSSVLTQFNEVDDTANNRKIFTQINQVTPATYKFKISF